MEVVAECLDDRDGSVEPRYHPPVDYVRDVGTSHSNPASQLGYGEFLFPELEGIQRIMELQGRVWWKSFLPWATECSSIFEP